MNRRYSWQITPSYYSSNGFNLEDAKLHRKWFIRDNEKGKLYSFPKEYIYDEQTGQYLPCTYVNKELYNYEFYLFMCETCPDYYAYPKEFITKDFLDIWVRNTSLPKIPAIKEEMLSEEQKQILDSRFNNPKKLTKHL